MAARLAGTGWHDGPDDLARNAPGFGVSHEAARRREAEGAGADRSWRVGADGEVSVAEVLAALTTGSRLDRRRRRSPPWRVLHSVPIGTGRGDVDHVVIGPPGIVTINTKHHHAGKIRVEGEQVMLNGYRIDYVAKARRETEHATSLVTTALTVAGHHDIAVRLRVQPVIAVVAGGY